MGKAALTALKAFLSSAKARGKLKNALLIVLAIALAPLLLLIFVVVTPIVIILNAVGSVFDFIIGGTSGVFDAVMSLFDGASIGKGLATYATVLSTIVSSANGYVDALYSDGLLEGGVDQNWMAAVLMSRNKIYETSEINMELSDVELENFKESLSMSMDEIELFVDSFLKEETTIETVSVCEGMTSEEMENVDCTRQIEVSKTSLYFDHDHDNNFESLNKNLGWAFDAEDIEYINTVYEQFFGRSDNGIYDEYESLSSLISEDLLSASKSKPYPSLPFDMPLAKGTYSITSEFGRRDPIILDDGTVTNEIHTGTDLGSPYGTAISAVGDGEVVAVRNTKIGLGLYCVIDHGGGIFSVYGHTSAFLVNEGDKVSKGQMIARVGSSGYSTGPHLHLEMIDNGKSVDARRFVAFP